MLSLECTAQDWFQEAARSYVEQHQGCAWCGGSHRVYLLERGTQVQYYCSGCEFTGYDRTAHQFYFEPGEKCEGTVRKTMYQI